MGKWVAMEGGLMEVSLKDKNDSVWCTGESYTNHRRAWLGKYIFIL